MECGRRGISLQEFKMEILEISIAVCSTFLIFFKEEIKKWLFKRS